MSPPPLASIPLLRAKMLPPSPGLAILRRARLLRQLKESLESPERRGTVVMAGAGYGKTTLVADFLRTTSTESVWYSIDPSDRDPILFFRYIIEGIRAHNEDFGRLAEGLLSELPSLSEGVERFVDVLINDANEALSSRVVLVLDDFHHLDGNETIMLAMRRLLSYLPDSLHIILISRSVPDIGMAHLRLRGSLAVIDRAELLFSEEETNSLVTEVLGVRMERTAVRELQERTQGWVTALQLLRQGAHGLAEEPGRSRDAIFARTESEIFEFFSEGVLAGESEEVRRFLRRSSLPAILEPEICARVLEDMPVRGLLESLLRRNLFIVPLAGRSDDYTYHPLFREFLARKLVQLEGEEAARNLHRRYARCFEERGEIASALHHHIQGGDPTALEVLLAREGGRLLEHGMIETVRLACASLHGLGAIQPRTELLKGEIARIEGDYAAAAGYFRRGLASTELPPHERAEALQGLAYVELKLGDLIQAVAHAGEALALAGGADLLRAKILNTVAIADYRSGRFESALEGWRSALDLARRGGDTRLLRKVAHNLGLPHAMRGEYDKALDYFRMLLVPGEGDEPAPGPDYATASLNVARIEILRGEYREAAGHLDDAMEMTRKYRLRALLGDVLEAQGNLLREMGDFAEARQKYAGARRVFTELGLEDLATGLDEEEAHLLLAAGSSGEALRVTDEILRSRGSECPAERLAPALMLAGRSRLISGDAGGALEPLRKARDLYRDLSFRYQEAEAGLHLAQAKLASGRPDGAEEPALAAMKLVDRYGYHHMARRLASGEPLRGFLAALPGAPLPADGGKAGAEGAALTARPATGSAARRAVGGALGGFDLTINMLGSVEVYRDELRKIPASAWTLKRALKILCYLAASRDRRATKDRIIDTFWRDARPSIIQKNFHPTISYLRKALNFSHVVNKNFILFEKGAYLLNPAYRYLLDASAFEMAVAAARKSARARNREGALASYREALSLYRGPFLEEDYDEWVEAPRTHYEALLTGTLEEAGALYSSAGRLQESLECFERLSRHDPLSEESSCHLMQVLGKMGNRAAVEREFGRLAKDLKRELDLDPLPETHKAYERALAVGLAPKGRPQSRERTDRPR